jgi:hypothetical protein
MIRAFAAAATRHAALFRPAPSPLTRHMSSSSSWSEGMSFIETVRWFYLTLFTPLFNCLCVCQAKVKGANAILGRFTHGDGFDRNLNGLTITSIGCAFVLLFCCDIIFLFMASKTAGTAK